MTRRASFWRRLLEAFRPGDPPVPTTFGYRLRSNLDGAFFRVRFSVLPHPSAQVREHILDIATQEAESASALEADLLELRLRLALIDSGLGFTYLRVHVVPEEPGIRLAEEHEQIKRDRVLEAERSKDFVEGLRFFRSQVLDQGLFGLWWLNAERDRLPDMGRSSEQIANAIALLRSGGSGESDDHLLTVFQRFLEELDGSNRERFLPQLVRLFQLWERQDLVQELTSTGEPARARTPAPARKSEPVPAWTAADDGHAPRSGAIGVGHPYR